MEFSSVIFFEHEDEEFVRELESLPYEEDELDLGNFELKFESPKATISFLGGYDAETDLQAVMNYLRENGANKVYGYTLGDEGPYISLNLADDEGILVYTLDPSLFEHIAECDPQDIEASEDLRTAHSEGPRSYFGDQFREWKSGLSGREISAVEEIVELVINASESTIS